MAVRRGSADRTVRVVNGRGNPIASLLNMELPDWHKDASCAQTDPEGFFPEKGGSTKEAKSLCNGAVDKHGQQKIAPCAAKDECLAYALLHGERYGVWGGLSERERRKLVTPAPHRSWGGPATKRPSQQEVA